MQKKSHISLAKYIVDSMKEQELKKHEKAFYLGSILPDCKPSFLTTRHEIEGTFSMVQESIRRLVEGEYGQNMRAFFRELGQVIHYVADYFTFPHNANYCGTLREHCSYETQLKKTLKEYIVSGEAARNRARVRALDTPEAICAFIQNAHDTYMNLKSDVDHDCQTIVALCHQVAEAVLKLFLGQGGPQLAKAV